jgi:hypothetical protein
LDKLGQVIDVGVDLIALALDDLPFHDGQGGEHGALTAAVRDGLPASVDLVVVPAVPDEVLIAWTGPAVVCAEINAPEVEQWTEHTGRRPLLWDNVPVNDMLLADRLFPGPLRGRPADVAPLLSGYLANPMIQARASIPALVSAAEWFRGSDPEAVWEQAIGDARVFAQSCGEHHTRALVDAALADDSELEVLTQFLNAAA